MMLSLAFCSTVAQSNVDDDEAVRDFEPDDDDETTDRESDTASSPWQVHSWRVDGKISPFWVRAVDGDSWMKE